MKFTLGTKEAMIQFFTEDGLAHPATVIKVTPSVVTQVKTVATDGYDAIQIGFGERKEKNINKPQLGHMKDLGKFRYLREFRTEAGDVKVGDVVKAEDVFTTESKIQVSGITKAKGFQGVVKRHNFKGGRRSHGQKHSEREPGSIGIGGVGRVFKGTRMGGRMGGERVTVKGLRVLSVDPSTNTMIVKGAVPGRRGTLLEIVTL